MSAIRKQVPTIHHHLQRQHCPVVFHPENGEHGGQERGISRQPDVGGRNLVRTAQAVNAMLQPVLGDVAINKRIVGDGRETKQEKQPQPKPRLT